MALRTAMPWQFLGTLATVGHYTCQVARRTWPRNRPSHGSSQWHLLLLVIILVRWQLWDGHENCPAMAVLRDTCNCWSLYWLGGSYEMALRTAKAWQFSGPSHNCHLTRGGVFEFDVAGSKSLRADPTKSRSPQFKNSTFAWLLGRL